MKNVLKIFVLLSILLAAAPAPVLMASGKSQSQAGEKDEFPQWARDLRRADIIAFGSLPFAFFLGGIVVDTYRASQHDWDTQYGPWPVNMGGAVSRTKDEHLATISIAAGGAVLVATADYIIQRLKRERAAREAARLAAPDPIIIRKPWPPGEEAEDGTPEETPLPGIGGGPESAPSGGTP
ncbi:MAG: hypothetical protein LBU18_03635 [Treponema sp.]|jgi:hypothetical protein|nr:hypothetical protein [Treponema sp.]